ncbi:MAG: hypothetical protein ACOCQE_01695 [Halanaerobium sp.]
MKKFLKKASIYLIIMLILAAVFSALNYYYGSKLAQDLKIDIQKAAEENNYQIQDLNLNANPLFLRVNIENMGITKEKESNIDIVDAEIKLSWQQIFYYIRNNDLAHNKDYTAEIKNINYSDLKNNHRFKFVDALLNYSGEFKIEEAEDIEYLLNHNHDFDLQAAELRYDFPYYRSYGITAESWEQLSVFKDLKLKADYKVDNRLLTVEEFILDNEFIDYRSDLKAEIRDTSADSKFEDEIIFNNLKMNYHFDFDGDGLKTEQNQYYKSLSFDDYNFNAYIDISLENPEKMIYTANQFDTEVNLNNFNLTFNEEISREINKNTFGIFAKDDHFSLKINSFNYDQEHVNPAGETESTLITPFVDSELEANYTFNGEEFYLDDALLKIKPKTIESETMFNFVQLIIDQQFEKDEDDYFLIRVDGELGNLDFN